METWIAIVSLAVAALVLGWWSVSRSRARRDFLILQVIIESNENKILFYDEKDRLCYCSPGLVLFEKSRVKRELKLPDKPLLGQTVRGEMEIDHNRYRYVAKSLEYRPGRAGTLVNLIYLNSVSAS